MTVSKIASTDVGYVTGQLSNFPEAIDTYNNLYKASNNSVTKLKQSATYAAKYLIVEDNSNFPENGILRIGPPPGESGNAEFVYYATKTSGVFKDLIRGFAGTRQNPWNIGSYVSNSVFAEHHNALKDAIINMQKNIGTKFLPEDGSLNAILQEQERRFLSPRPLFRAFPLKGPPGTKIRFQNFSTGPLIRYLWDFGDGTTSVEKSPTHIYEQEGIYSVRLNVITSLGAQGVITKSNYITIDQEEKTPFFYSEVIDGETPIYYSTTTAAAKGKVATKFRFVDQTDGNIVQRYWVFGDKGNVNGVYNDNESVLETNPNIHTIEFEYKNPGTYEPSLLVLFESQKLQRVFLRDKITVI